MSAEEMMPDSAQDTTTREVLAREIVDLQRAFTAAAWRVVGPPVLPDLTPQQFRVLRLIAAKPGVAASGVGHHLRVTAPTASGIVDRLVEKGVVERGDDPHDRRVRRLTLTEAGQRLLVEVDSAAGRMMVGLLPHLETDLLRRIRETYADMVEALRDVEGDASGCSELC